jgi:hypothetical protein
MDKKELNKIISAFMLGDGCLRIWNNRPKLNPAYSLSQTSDHEDYVMWQYEVLSNITSVSLKKYDASIKNGISRKSFFKLETKSHPFFKVLRERWYNNGRKTISVHDLKQFDFQMFAIWYMDDGYLLKHNNTIFLCTDCFNYSELLILQKVIYEKLGIAMNIRKRGFKKDGSRIYRLVANKKNTLRIIEGIRPFIFPSFEYKIRTENPNLGDEIV